MPNAIMMVQLDQVDASDDASDQLLTTKHIPDVLKVAGFVSARRFQASEALLTSDTPPPARLFPHFYELDNDGSREQLRRIADDLIAAIASGAAALSEVLDLSVTATYFDVR